MTLVFNMYATFYIVIYKNYIYKYTFAIYTSFQHSNHIAHCHGGGGSGLGRGWGHHSQEFMSILVFTVKHFFVLLLFF